MAKDRIIELGRKLLALAQRGVGGERENAQSMLDAFLEKHGLTMTDIEPETRTRRIVTAVSADIKQMFINFCASIVGHKVVINRCVGRGYWAVEMNDAEWADFSERWPIYKKELKAEILRKKRQQKRELELVAKAFISKHNLYSTDREDDGEVSLPTAEELEEILEMLRIREKMKDLTFHKKLNQ